MIAWLLACTGKPPTPVECQPGDVPQAYVVDTWTEPAEVEAGQTVEFWIQITDQDGCPIEDLQQSHERMVHTVFISGDLATFQHLHHEDYYEITADDLRRATFHFPVGFPAAGDTLAVFDFAHLNAWRQEHSLFEVTGSPAQGDEPELDHSVEVAVDDIIVSFSWEVVPVAGLEAALALEIRDDSGADVTDLVPWLGADGHVAFVKSTLDVAGHTHAWLPGMEAMTPSMEMESKYTGPYLPFRYTFPVGGAYKAWFQFARSDRPDEPYVVPFAFDVVP